MPPPPFPYQLSFPSPSPHHSKLTLLPLTQIHEISSMSYHLALSSYVYILKYLLITLFF